MTPSRSRRKRGRARNRSGTVTPRRLADGRIVYDALTPEVWDPVKGKRRRIPKGGHESVQAAQEWIQKTLQELESGERILERRGGPTVDDMALRWAASSPLKETTVERYRYNYFNAISPLIGQEPIGRLRSTDLDELFAQLSQKYSPSMMHALIRPMTAIWDYAVRAGAARINIVKESPWPKKLRQEAAARREEKRLRHEEGDGLIRVFTPDQLKTLVEAEKLWRYRALWLFIVLTGARIGEVCGLRWADVNFDRETIWFCDNYQKIGSKYLLVDTPKGNRRRKIPAAPEVLDLLKQQKVAIEKAKAAYPDKWVEHDLVFPRMVHFRHAPTPVGGYQSPDTISVKFSERCDRLGLPHITLHGLRHTFASAAYEGGVDIKTIQDILGHRLDITTLIYVHTNAETQKDAMVRVVDWVKRAT